MNDLEVSYGNNDVLRVLKLVRIGYLRYLDRKHAKSLFSGVQVSPVETNHKRI